MKISKRLLASLVVTACMVLSAFPVNAESEDIIYGQVTEIDGNDVTIDIGTLNQNNDPGTGEQPADDGTAPTDIPDETGEQPADDGTAPADIPDETGEQPADDGTAPTDIPDGTGDQPVDNGENNAINGGLLTLTGESMTFTLTDELTEDLTENIEVGSVLKITYTSGADTIESVEILSGSVPDEMPGDDEGTTGYVSYSTQVQNIGWQNAVSDGELSGTEGEGLRLEGIKIETSIDGLGIEYATQVENIGWQDFVSDGELSGTEGEGLRLEAIKIQLTGDEADNYDVYYRVQVENLGWLGWASNGEESGTEGYGYRLESIEIQIVEKGASFDTGDAAFYAAD